MEEDDASAVWLPVQERDVYKFTMRHTFAMKNHALSGATIPQLWTMLYRHASHVNLVTYGFRLFFLHVLATINTIISWVEGAVYGSRISKQELNDRPIFILGHPRSGTTLIHNIMSKDPRFAYCTTFMCGFPSTFLCMEGAKKYMAGIIDKTRPMDNMELHFDLPQEDELATQMLSGGVSPYMCISFMTAARSFWSFFTFRNASPQDFRSWRNAFIHFLKKVTFRWGGSSKRMVIKSPVHTARVKLLLEMFPKAQFIYVHRHPYEVYASASHMADTYYWYCYFSKPRDGEVTDFIVNQYELLHREYVATRSLIPKGNLVEVRFEDLERDHVGEMKRIYDGLGLDWHGNGQKGRWAEEYCKQLKGFKKNNLRRLSDGMRRMVQERWGDSFREWGYKM